MKLSFQIQPAKSGFKSWGMLISEDQGKRLSEIREAGIDKSVLVVGQDALISILVHTMVEQEAKKKVESFALLDKNPRE